MSWTAVVPLKAAAARKSRLAGRLSAEERGRLSQAMAAHVLARLAACPGIGRTLLLSPDPPVWRGVDWRVDGGRGLNGELAGLREDEAASALLVVHADLPLVTGDDALALIEGAERCGWAIAPDRHGLGTNALAMAAGRTFGFAFGPDSFRRHLGQAPQAAVVRRPGLMLDVDTPDDLDAALAAGLPAAGAPGRGAPAHGAAVSVSRL